MVSNLACVYFEYEPERRSAVKLLSKDEARRMAATLQSCRKLLMCAFEGKVDFANLRKCPLMTQSGQWQLSWSIVTSPRPRFNFVAAGIPTFDLNQIKVIAHNLSSTTDWCSDALYAARLSN